MSETVHCWTAGEASVRLKRAHPRNHLQLTPRTQEEFAHRDGGEMATMSSSLGEGVNILVTKGTFFAVGYFASVPTLNPMSSTLNPEP